MTKKTSPSPKRPRWQSLVGTGIALLVLLFIYLQTGSVPKGALEAVLGTEAATVAAVLDQTTTEAGASATATPTAASTRRKATATVTPTNRRATATPTAASTTRKATATVTPTSQRATATPTAASTRRKTTPTPTGTPTRVRSQSGLPVVLYDDLPRQAQETIRLIDDGGPFPFRQDDSTFQNREGILPRKPRGFYREYTVITPGSPDRGARRIIAGEDGVLFYTDDHYDSFREVIR